MELARSTSPGGFSVRSFLTFVVAVLVTAFLWVIFSGPLTHAAADATWNGDRYAEVMYSRKSLASRYQVMGSKEVEASRHRDGGGGAPGEEPSWRT